MPEKKTDYGTFIFYKSFYDSLVDCDEEFRNKAFNQIINYGLFGIEPDESDKLLKILWANWKPLIDSDHKKKKGGAPVGNQNAKGNKGGPGRPKKKHNQKTQPSDVDGDVDVNQEGLTPSPSLREGEAPANEGDDEEIVWGDPLEQLEEWRRENEQSV